jgi:BirA family biotin operon repressor/biotin-[acetyl-CoA-carboxylase] ligase
LYKIPASTLFMGKNLVYVPECHSTNTIASELCQRTTSVEGTAVITDNQTKGRGQRGNSWHSDPYKNLTFSLILKPTFLRPIEQFNLTVAVSLALHDFLTQRTPGEVKIKWPNDVLVNGKKLGGILIENTLAGDTIQCSVIGIGLNVNQDSFLIDSASSMKEVAGHDFNLADEWSMLCGFVERRYLQLRSGNFTDLNRDYLSSLYAKGEQRRFMVADGEMQGVIEGVNQQGKLLVASEGETRLYDLKEIRFIG